MIDLILIGFGMSKMKGWNDEVNPLKPSGYYMNHLL
jgi:hypothetical protein